MEDDASNHILDRLFEFERNYLQGIPRANYTFGVYIPKAPAPEPAVESPVLAAGSRAAVR